MRGHAAAHLRHGAIGLPRHACHASRSLARVPRPQRWRQDDELQERAALPGDGGGRRQQDPHRREAQRRVHGSRGVRQQSHAHELERDAVHATVQSGFRSVRADCVGVSAGDFTGEELFGGKSLEYAYRILGWSML